MGRGNWVFNFGPINKETVSQMKQDSNFLYPHLLFGLKYMWLNLENWSTFHTWRRKFKSIQSWLWFYFEDSIKIISFLLKLYWHSVYVQWKTIRIPVSHDLDANENTGCLWAICSPHQGLIWSSQCSKIKEFYKNIHIFIFSWTLDVEKLVLLFKMITTQLLPSDQDTNTQAATLPPV